MISDCQRFPLQGLRSAHHGPAESRRRRLLAGRDTVGLDPITMRVDDEARLDGAVPRTPGARPR